MTLTGTGRVSSGPSASDAEAEKAHVPRQASGTDFLIQTRPGRRHDRVGADSTIGAGEQGKPASITGGLVADMLKVACLASYDGTAELERGPDVLLTGLAATLAPPAYFPVGSERVAAGHRLVLRLHPLPGPPL